MDNEIFRGAEAIITLENNIIKKERIRKSYRNEKIDEDIRKKRTKQEAKILAKAKAFSINVPQVLDLDKKNIPVEKYIIKMEYIKGDKVSEKLNDYEIQKQYNVMRKLGKEVFKLHLNNIIHGDLTTSNVILRDNEVFIIDFGLGFFSSKIEDKAVDLHLIKQALEAKHYENYQRLFFEFLEGYDGDEELRIKVIEHLRKVESRGRYKKRVG